MADLAVRAGLVGDGRARPPSLRYPTPGPGSCWSCWWASSSGGTPSGLVSPAARRLRRPAAPGAGLPAADAAVAAGGEHPFERHPPWPRASRSLPVLVLTLPSPPPLGPMIFGSFALLYSQMVLPTPSGAGVVELGFLGGAAGQLGEGQGWILLAWRFYTNGHRRGGGRLAGPAAFMVGRCCEGCCAGSRCRSRSAARRVTLGGWRRDRHQHDGSFQCLSHAVGHIRRRPHHRSRAHFPRFPLPRSSSPFPITTR